MVTHYKTSPSPAFLDHESIYSLSTALSVIPRRHWEISARPICSGKPTACVRQDDRRVNVSNHLLQLCIAIAVPANKVNLVIV